MKLKTAAILSVIVCIFGAAHYNEPLTLSVTLPSPAQVVDAIGKVADELKESADSNSLGNETQYAASITETGDYSTGAGIYRVRTSWEDYTGQLGAYEELKNAINNCPVGYYVFNESGEIVYDPNL